jgi:predicted 3-demethylubiquinone-9 3-methyltransferase (glyoxalase superfamily)
LAIDNVEKVLNGSAWHRNASSEEGTMSQKITTFLWFDDKAEEATTFYVSLFKNSEVLDISRQGEDGPAFMTRFRLDGQEFMALNGGPHFSFSEAISLFVNCESQAEVDDLWEKLTADGGEPSQCGWLKDKYGLSWQIIPTVLMELMADEDRERANRVMQAMLKMSKIDIAALQAAAG